MNKTLLKLTAISMTFGMTNCVPMPKEIYKASDFKESDKAIVLDSFMSKVAPDKPNTLIVEFDTDRDNVPEYVAGISEPSIQEQKMIRKNVVVGKSVSLKNMAEIFKGVHYVNTRND